MSQKELTSYRLTSLQEPTDDFPANVNFRITA